MTFYVLTCNLNFRAFSSFSQIRAQNLGPLTTLVLEAFATDLYKLIINKLVQIVCKILNQKSFGYLIYNHFQSYSNRIILFE